MERFNFQAIEKKWRKKFSNLKLENPKGKKVLLLGNVSLPVWVKSIWGMFEIIL